MVFAPAEGLNYVESSAGLETPALEGGRTEVEMADVNDDGHVDLLSIGDHGSPFIDTSEHGVMVWFGDGTGAWSVFQYGNFGYGGIAVGDVNGDGLADVGYGMHHDYSGTDLGDQILEVALGDGTGMFWTPWDDGLATNGETWGMFGTDFADVDNDGDLDVGSVSFGCCAGVHVYLNQGDGTWVQSFGFVGGNSTQEFVFGDVDGDGNADFAAAHQHGTVYLGDGSGGFTLADGNLPPAGSLGRAGPDLGDVDGDGDDDLSFATSSGGVQVWLWGGPDAWQAASAGLPASGSYAASRLHDMDGDGVMDLTAFGGGRLTVWTGDGAGGWSQAASFVAGSPGYYQALCVGGDADHNGMPDIAIVDEEGAWPNERNHLHFFRETGSPAALTARVVEPSANVAWVLGSVRFADWAAAVPGTDPARARLELSVTGGGGPWDVIADDLPNSGRHQWIVAADGPSADCRVRLRVTAGPDTAWAISERFTILPAGVIGAPETSVASRPSLVLRPNPASGGVWIEFPGLAPDRSGLLELFDVAGRRVASVAVGGAGAGRGRVFWNGRDGGGRLVPCGVYHVRLRAGEASAAGALTVAR
jgi:hypothetical protein